MANAIKPAPMIRLRRTISAAAWLRPGSRGPAVGNGPHPGRLGPCFVRPQTLCGVRACRPAASSLPTPRPLLRRGASLAARVRCGAARPRASRCRSRGLRRLRRRCALRCGPVGPFPPPGRGRCPRLLRSARVRAPRSVGARWPRCASALPLLRCGLPVRAALLRAGAARALRGFLAGPPFGPAASGSAPPASSPGLLPGRGPGSGAVSARAAACGRFPPAGVPPAGAVLGPRCLGFACAAGSASLPPARTVARPGALLRWWPWGSPLRPSRPRRPRWGLRGSAVLILRGLRAPTAYGSGPPGVLGSVAVLLCIGFQAAPLQAITCSTVPQGSSRAAVPSLRHCTPGDLSLACTLKTKYTIVRQSYRKI